MWRFRELSRGEPQRDPHEAEFFRRTNKSEAVVREFIQNSLDARQEGNNPVSICFTFGNVEYLRDYFEGLESHYPACNFKQPYNASGRISYLTIEDFGTTGLDGPTGEDHIPEGKSNFYAFWLCEGKSRKSGREGLH